MANNGKNYEEFVRAIQQHLIDLEPELKYKNIKIEKNKKIKSRFGSYREFDLYWEWEMAGIVYKTIIECKDYNSYISIEKIDSLIGKINDFPDIKPIFATKIGYQSGAEKKAQEYNIDLLIIRETNESDWVDANGNSYVKEVGLNITILGNAKFTYFMPFFDSDWLKENNISVEELANPFNRPENEIFIDDREREELFSLYELKEKISDNEIYSEQTVKIKCDDAYIIIDDRKYKLKGYIYKYIFTPPHNEKYSINFLTQLKGVVENITRKNKKMVFNDKVINR